MKQRRARYEANEAEFAKAAHADSVQTFRQGQPQTSEETVTKLAGLHSELKTAD